MVAAMPMLSDAEVDGFVRLTEQAHEAWRFGDTEGAARLFRKLTDICRTNPEPFVSLAMLNAAAGNKSAALDHLRSAMARGFVDLDRIEQAESWTPMRNNPEFRELRRVVPLILEAEDAWPDWDEFVVGRTAKSALGIFEQHDRGMARIDRIAPALGEIVESRWRRLVERVSAAFLEDYLKNRPEAEDHDAALERLMALYVGGPLRRWDSLEPKGARRLAQTSALVLNTIPDSPMRSEALVGLALGWNVERDKRGRLNEKALKNIRVHLGEVVRDHRGSPLFTAATVGLIRTEAEVGNHVEAARLYRSVVDEADQPILDEVREQLGSLALTLGGLPRFQAPALDGERFDVAALEGKVTVVDFWATWCAPCVEGFSTLRKIESSHGDDVMLLGINLDAEAEIEPDALKRWIADEQAPGTHLRDGLGWQSELVKAFGVTEIPFSVVVAADGSVAAVNQHGKNLEKAVNAALAAR